jgi:TonB family protein
MRTLVLATLFAVLAGCASPDGPRYISTYQIAGAPGVYDEISSDRAHRTSANENYLASTARRFDQPIRLLRAPQPRMPPIKAGSVGEVVVDIVFAENGLVERTEVRRSTHEALTRAVLDAVSQWEITPALHDGKPTKFEARQAFKFVAEG